MIGCIPAAGRGVRFKELGKHYSKTILPYKEKPILIHQIEFLESQGCNDIRVVLNHAEDTVKGILKFYNKDVTICKQEERNGLSGAVHSALKSTDDDNVLILLGDLVVDEPQYHQSYEENFISVQKVPDYSRWCMVETNKGAVSKFFDKPQERPKTDLAVSGIYHFVNSKKLHVLLTKQLSNDKHKIAGEFQLSTVLQWVAEKETMKAYDINLIDFGTLEEYLENRAVKISRSFNDITIDGPFVTKSSHLKGDKLIAEYNWFQNLPDKIKVHTPRIFDYNFYDGSIYYKMEKVKAPTIRDIYLFLDSSEETWDMLFDSMFGLLNGMLNYGQPNTFMKSVVQKTKDRVKDIDIPIENKLVQGFLGELGEMESSTPDKFALMHGDFCFSNLLYDMNGNITMIDPRGEMFGSHYYEVAKICHSILFDYDFVDAELYLKDNESYQLYNKGKQPIKDLFISKINKYYSKDELKYILLVTASLFLSMIPLHDHNKNNQEIYYDIFKNIYRELRNEDDIRITRGINFR